MKKLFNKYLMAPVLLMPLFLIPVKTVSADNTETAGPITNEPESSWPLCTDTLNIPMRPVVEAELVPGDVHVAADDGRIGGGRCQLN